MSVRIIPDQDQPSAAIEISLEHPLPDYDLEDLDQPTPRDVDAILVSQGFRDLVDDSRGVLTELICAPLDEHEDSGILEMELTPPPPHPLEIAQLTGAICPGDDEVYRPGLWIVLRDQKSPAKKPLEPVILERIRRITSAFVKRMQLG